MIVDNISIKVVKGDITQTEADAIVNAANPSLMGGGGVDGAIHQKGGPKILEECKSIVKKDGRCKVGDAVITTAGNLPAKHVIHTVGPVWQGGNSRENEYLRQAYTSCLKLAEQHGLSTIAFPTISTGIYGYPKELAVSEVKAAIEDHFNNGSSSTISELYFVCFDEENYDLYKQTF